MHFIEGSIHPTRKVTLDQKATADQGPHQATDRAVFPERYQRAEIAVSEFGEGPPFQQMAQLLDHEIRLLMSGLGARRYVLRKARARTGRAIPNRKNIVVACRLQRRPHRQLVDAVGFKPRYVGEKGWRLHAADQTTSSEGINSPSESFTPSANTSATRALVRTSTPNFTSSSLVEAEMRSGRAGRIRSAASIRTIRRSCSGSMLVKPTSSSGRSNSNQRHGALQLFAEPNGVAIERFPRFLAGNFRSI